MNSEIKASKSTYDLINQAGVSQIGVQGWTEEHCQHADGQSPAGVPKFRCV